MSKRKQSGWLAGGNDRQSSQSHKEKAGLVWACVSVKLQ
jgi:hypothetical protein